MNALWFLPRVMKCVCVGGGGVEGTGALCLGRKLEEGPPKVPGLDQRCCRSPSRLQVFLGILQLEKCIKPFSITIMRCLSTFCGEACGQIYRFLFSPYSGVACLHCLN